MKILIALEDEKTLNEFLKTFSENKIESQGAKNGLSALTLFHKNRFDLAILSISLKDIDGITVMKEMKKNKNLPIFLIGERTDEQSIAYAYEAGCNDYLRKPVYCSEILLKLSNFEKLKKRNTKKYGALEIDYSGRMIYIDGKEKEVTQKEFQLLTYLVENQGQAISREQLLNDVWGYEFYGDDRTIDTHIKMIRNNLGLYKDYIQTLRGFGYKFEVK